MKKLGWYAVSAVVAAFILCGGLLLAANLYVQSRVVQHRIRSALSANLRMPVSLRKTTFTPWDGLRIDGIAARIVETKTGADEEGSPVTNSLSAHSFRVSFAFTSLFNRHFVIKDVLLDYPRLSWMQDADDRWRLPSEATASKKASERTPSAGSGSPAPASADSPPMPTVAGTASPTLPEALPGDVVETADETPRSQPLTVDKFRLRHGSMDFLNHRRGLLGRFEGVNVDGHLLAADHAVGVATFEKASLPRAGVKLARFQGGFSYERAAGLTLSNATAGFAGGGLTANCRVRTGETGTPYDVQCRLENVSIEQLIKDAGGGFGLIEGRLQGKVDVSGVSDDPARNNVTGEIQLVDAQIRNLPLFQAVGNALQIEDLQQLRFKTARLAYHVEGTTVQIQSLDLVSNNLTITAQGHYLAQDDKLDLHARLLIDRAITRQLPQIVAQQFTSSGDETPGSRYIDFDIKGPISKPSSNLYQRMLPNNLNSLLDGLLRPRPKRPKGKPSLPADQPSPSEDAREP